MDGDSPLFTPEEALGPSPESPLLTPRPSPEAAAASKPRGGPKRERCDVGEAAPALGDSAISCFPAFAGATPSAEKYRRIEKVGVGAYGNVYKAENVETKEIVAIKVTFRKEDPILGGFPLSLLREVCILRRVNHENIVQIHEVAQTPKGDPLIVMEFCHASLLELMHSRKHDLSFSEIKYIIRQLLDATNHLHERGILHRDLATKNVLFNLSGEIKVCDFGISRVAFAQDEQFGYLSARNLERPDQIVSLPYRAVELLLGDPRYGPALDVWAVGCIFGEVLMCQAGRRQPFFGGTPENPNKTPEMMLGEIFMILGRPCEETWLGLTKLPLYKAAAALPQVAAARQHTELGDERAFLRRFFLSREGKPVNSKYCLTESCYDLLGGLFTLCPAKRTTASEALRHGFFTAEKPEPQWHAWHWNSDQSEILRGDKMIRRHEDANEKLLEQLSKKEPKPGEDGGPKAGAANGKSTGKPVNEVLDQWRRKAERRAAEQKEQKQFAGDKRSGRKPADEAPPGWTKHWSSSRQKFYYHEKKTGRNAWQMPT